MLNNVVDFALRLASAAKIKGVHRTSILVIALLVNGCNSATNQAMGS